MITHRRSPNPLMLLVLVALAVAALCAFATSAVAGPDTPQLALGDEYSVLVKPDGSLWTWGNGTNGQLGLGPSSRYRTKASRVGTDTDWMQVAAGYQHTLALKVDGSLWAWGNNLYGRLGVGDEVTRWAPTRVGVATDWVAVAAGLRHSFAIKSDGSLYAWGRNDFGQLGLGNTQDRLSPVKVGDGFAVVDGGGQFSAAVKTDGSLWTWGRNNYGQLGLGNTTDRPDPMRVGAGTDWTTVSCSDEAARALQADHSLWAWGRNSYGQLGVGDEATRSAPEQVTGSWAKVLSADDSTLAIDADGALWAWGDNTYGQLGQGAADLGAHPVPLKVGTAADWSAVAPGHDHVAALSSDGGLWVWGKNGSAQLGLGDTTDRAVPTFSFNATDVIAPAITSVVSTSHPNIDVWYADATPVFSWTATDDHTGDLRYSFLIDTELWTIPDEITDGTAQTWTAPATADGTWFFHVRAADAAGNWGEMKRVRVKIDTTAPVTTDDAPARSVTAVTVHLSATDAGAGVAGTEYKLDGGDWTPGTTVTVSGDGAHTLIYRSTDAIGNVEIPKSRTITIGPLVVDTTAPVTTDDAPSGWVKTPVTVHLSATDGGSGVAGTQYKLDGATDWTSGTAVQVSGDGVHTIFYRSTDVAGNIEPPKTCTVRIDGSRPVTLAPKSARVHRGRSVALTYRVNDTGSPQATVTIKVKTLRGKTVKVLLLGKRAANVTATYKFRCTLPKGKYRFYVYATDLAGNTQSSVGRNSLTVY